MIYVVVTMQVRPGCREKFATLFNSNRPAVLAEEGCLLYQLCANYDGSDPDTLTLIEEWESDAALQAHLEAPHMKAFAQAAAPLRVGAIMKKLRSA